MQLELPRVQREPVLGDATKLQDETALCIVKRQLGRLAVLFTEASEALSRGKLYIDDVRANLDRHTSLQCAGRNRVREVPPLFRAAGLQVMTSILASSKAVDELARCHASLLGNSKPGSCIRVILSEMFIFPDSVPVHKTSSVPWRKYTYPSVD